jgi:hypothetical protein
MCYESRIEISRKEPTPEEIIDEITKNTKIPSSDIFIDLPSSPNVPYSHFDRTRSNEIISFKRTPDGQKIPVRLEDYSMFFNQFRGHLKLVRVYTWEKYRKQLTEICQKRLGENLEFFTNGNEIVNCGKSKSKSNKNKTPS